MDDSLTRQNLYELVWSKPMLHIARDYNMTDTGIRKYCKRYDIPTPTSGYWMKLAHKKPVRRKPLPVKNRSADEPTNLVPAKPPSIETEKARETAQAKQDQVQSVLTVSDKLPSNTHGLVRKVRTALRGIKPDDHGFIELNDPTLPQISIGKASISRVLLLMQTLFKYAEKIGYTIKPNERHLCWFVNGEPFPIRIYEANNKISHKPTRKDLQKQANHDRWRTDDKIIYRKWDYVPSGKLTISLRDTNSYRWYSNSNHLARRWSDRKSAALETFIAEIFTWVEPASVMARERRLIREKERRIAFEASERERLINERLVTTRKLKKYLDELADIHSQATKISELIGFFIKQKHSATTQRMIDEANSYRAYLNERLNEETISIDVKNIGIDFDDKELFMPVLALPVLHSWDYR